MKLKIGFMTGALAGFYLGTMAGRERFHQINRTVGRVRRSSAVVTATDAAAHATQEGFERAKERAQHRLRPRGRRHRQPNVVLPS